MLVEAFKYAFSGSVSRAGAWAPLPGAVLVWAVLAVFGYQVAPPETWWQGIGVFLLCAAAAWVLIFISRLFWWPIHELKRLRKVNNAVEIIFDPKDEAYVRPIMTLHEQSGEFFSVGIVNPGSSTVYDVTLRALTSWFAQVAIGTGHFGHAVEHHSPIDLLKVHSLHPGTPQIVQLFGLSYSPGASNPSYIFNTVQKFTLELSGRDVAGVRKTFEYNPKSRPMMRMLD